MCRRLQSVINFAETSWSLQPCRKAVLLPRYPDTVRRYARPADSLPSQSGSDRLEKRPIDPRRRHHYMGDGALALANPTYFAIIVLGMPDRVRHIITSFDTALNNLKNDVLMMSSLAERLIENAMQGLLKRDSSLCNMTIADDEEVDVLEKQVDKEGIEIMIRFHPVASDIRQVITTMKLGANLERVADQSVAIARRAKKMNLLPAVPGGFFARAHLPGSSRHLPR